MEIPSEVLLLFFCVVGISAQTNDGDGWLGKWILPQVPIFNIA
jgi:hypothetical protein